MFISHNEYNSIQSKALTKVGSFVAAAFSSGFWTSTAPLLSQHSDSSRFNTLIDSHHDGRFSLITNMLLKDCIDSFESDNLKKLLKLFIIIASSIIFHLIQNPIQFILHFISLV
jgi:hypothetical protein